MGMGSLVRYEKVTIYLKLICGILCIFNFLLIIMAYAKLFTMDFNFTFFVSGGIYLTSYFVPPFLYDFKGTLCKIHHLLLGFVCYMFCIPMYQIVFQVFAYANFHDVTWGNREDSQLTQKGAKSKKTPEQ